MKFGNQHLLSMSTMSVFPFSFQKCLHIFMLFYKLFIIFAMHIFPSLHFNFMICFEA